MTAAGPGSGRRSGAGLGPAGGDASRAERARQRKQQQAEAHVAWMRDAVAGFVWLTVPFLLDRFPTAPLLTMLVVGTVHTGLAHVAYRRSWGSLAGRTLVTSLGDASVIVVLLALSGGAASPLTPLLYVSMAAIAYRYELRHSLAFGGLYATSYLALMAGLGDLGPNTVDLVLRAGLLVATGMLAALSSASYLEAELERSRTEATFEHVLETVPGDVVVLSRESLLDPAGSGDTLPARQPVAEAMPGWMDEHEIGRSLEALARVFATGETVEYEVSTGKAPDRVATYRCVAGPLEREGEITAVVVVATDVTDRKLAERRLRDHARALQQSNEALARYASLTAHDLREPLRDIVRYLQRIQRRETELAPETREEMAFVVQRARRLDSLVRALHDFAEVDERPFETEQIDLEAALEDALQRADLEGPTRVEIETGDLGTVTADRRAIVQILAHLVENAQEHGGRANVRVFIDAEETEDGWRITVEDDGQGIPPRYHEQIFEPFQRLEADARSQRTGMGLATVRRLVERLGGDIEVEAHPGPGARFVIRLPRRPVLVGGDEDVGPEPPAWGEGEQDARSR